MHKPHDGGEEDVDLLQQEPGFPGHDYLWRWEPRQGESAFIPFVSFGDLDNNTFKGLTSLLSVEQEIQYDEHT